MAYCDDDIISPTTTQPIPQKRSGGGGGGGGEGREGRGGGGGNGGGGKISLTNMMPCKIKRNQNANFIIKFNERINFTHARRHKKKKRTTKNIACMNWFRIFVYPQNSSVLS